MPDNLPERASRLLAFALRHDPRACGLTLDEQGFAELGSALSFLSKKLGRTISDDELRSLLGSNPRFEVLERTIRAKYGHGRAVGAALATREFLDPEALAESDPVLLHGSTVSAARAILLLGQGLRPRSRRRVALTRLAAARDAVRVARRHKPGSWLILGVAVAEAAKLGSRFHATGAHVVEADAVPAPAIAALAVFGAAPAECERLLAELSSAGARSALFEAARAVVWRVLRDEKGAA